MKQTLTVLGFGAVGPYTLVDVPHDAAEAPLTSAAGARWQSSLDLALLERTLRRGLSDVTRLFMHAAKLALDDAGREPAHTHVIFASAFGEIGTAEALLAEAYEANASSPARFRNSVHNTSPGLLSISTHNRLASTAVAAGWETVPMALLEAAAQLACEAETVLLVFAEERVPSALSDQHPHGPLGAAFVLSRAAGPNARARSTLRNLRREPQGQRAASALPFAPHPLAPVLALVEALTVPTGVTPARGPRERTVALGDGENPWCLDVLAGEPS